MSSKKKSKPIQKKTVKISKTVKAKTVKMPVKVAPKASSSKKAPAKAQSRNEKSTPALKSSGQKVLTPFLSPSKAAKSNSSKTIRPYLEKKTQEILDIETISKPLATRQSASVYFSWAELEDFLSKRKGGVKEKSDTLLPSPASKVAAPVKKTVPQKLPSAPKKSFGAANILDILGFNPTQQTREKYEEKDVPKKWKQYYKLLMEIRAKYSKGISELSEDVLKRNDDSTSDMSAHGQHLGDAGSESFERDLAFTILSDEKETLAEIDAAVERMKQGSYGICEITKKPIPEQRLLAIPFTRYSKEGQELMEAEKRKQKLAARTAMAEASNADLSMQPAEEEERIMDR